MKNGKTGAEYLTWLGSQRMAVLVVVIGFLSLLLGSCGENNPAPLNTATLPPATATVTAIPATTPANPTPTLAATPTVAPTVNATPSIIFTVTATPAVTGDSATLARKLPLQTVWRTDTNPDRLRGLTGLATDSQGNVYLSDYSQGIVRKYNPQGQQLFELKGKEHPDTFENPGGLATDRQGNLYVLASDRPKVYKYDASGKLLFSFQSIPDGGPGAVGSASSLAIDDRGIIYVLDYQLGRVYRFDAAGKYLSAWGNPAGQDNQEQNTAPGRLKFPIGLATDGKNFIYVGDLTNRRIQKFTLDGKYVANWPSGSADPTQSWDYTGPNGLATDRQGNVYVADTAHQRVQKFTASGQLLATIGQGYGQEDGRFNWPYGVAVDPQGMLYVNDRGNERIQKFDSAGKVVAKIGRQNKGEGELTQPYGLAVDGAGNVYTSEEVTRLIQKFDRDGHFVQMWPVESQVKVSRESPTGLALSADASGNLYVADMLDNMIKKYDSRGQLVLSWGGTGTQDGQFNGPGNSFVDPHGNIYVTDGGNHRLQVFDSQGRFLTKYDFGLEPPASSGQIYQQTPVAVALDAAGNMFVAFNSCNCVRQYDAKGTLLLEWGRPPEGTNGDNGQIFIPVNLGLDSQGNVYVMDMQNSHCSGCRIQKFTSDGQLLAVWNSLFSPSPMSPPPPPGNGEFTTLRAMAVDRQGNLYVAEPGYGRLQKLRQAP